MGAFMLILFYVHYETSFDNFHKDQDRVYRLIMSRNINGAFASKRPDTYPAMAAAIEAQNPGVEAITKLMYNSRGGVLTSFGAGDDAILRDDLATIFISASFFEVFSLPLIQGSPTSLDDPFNAMLSEKLALQLFGDEDPVGKTFKEDDGSEYLITGIFNKWQGNSHLEFDLIKSYGSIGARHNSDLHEVSWNWGRMKTYVKLESGVDATSFEYQVAQVVNDNKPKAEGVEIDELISLQSLADIRLGSDFETTRISDRRAAKVYGFLLIGLIILFMGWLNFVNLNIARGLDRIKESGVKKVLGAGRSHLIWQHFTEAFYINLLATIIGLSIFQLLLPQLRTIAEIPVSFGFSTTFVLWLIPAVVLGSLVSGVYPAFSLSKVQVILALRNKLTSGTGSISRVRTILNSVQFVISLSLLIGVGIIYQQLNHLKSVDLGTRIEGVLVVKGPRQFDYDQFSANPEVIKNELRRLPGIEMVSSSYAIPGSNIYAYQIKEVNQPDDQRVYIPEHTVGHDFLKLYDLELIAGRDFSTDFASDDRAAIISESAVTALGFESAEDALGKQLTSPENEFIRQVIGVIKDFHQQSAASPKQPVLFGLDTESRGYYSIKFNTANLKDLQGEIQQTFQSVFPGNIYHSFFLDDHFASQYQADETLGILLTIFAFVAISLAAMGLVSMTYFSVIRRMKELSIRKVLGADLKHLLKLLTAHGNISFIISVLVSIPVTYYLLNSWLSGYYERISLTVIDFALPVVGLYALAYVSMLLVTGSAIRKNPVEALRQE